jgi:penicillin-binding protein 1A
LFQVAAVAGEGAARRLRLTLDQEPQVEGGLVAIDTKTGAVRAMIGGFSFGRSKFNRATQAFRQLGSAFKPIVYATAIERLGMTAATLIADTPVSYPDAAPGAMWSPQNYDHAFLGDVTLRHALEQSRNVPAVRTLQAVGFEPTIQCAKRLGLSSDLPPYLPLALGAGEATLTEITAAFGAFANQGFRMKPTFITRVTDRAGNVLEEARPEATDALRPDTAYLITDLLRGVVQRGTAAAAASLERPIAGKTGTTDDFTDAWFVGYEPSLAAGVWVGYDDKRRSLGREETGARAALPIWISFWKKAMAQAPIESFPVPSNIVFVPVDALGRRASPGAPGVHLEPFVAGTEPGAARGTS